MNFKKLVLLLLLGSPVFLGAQGFTDGFMKAKGEGTIALTYSHEYAENYFFGDQIQFIDLTTRSLSGYLSWGISNQFNLVMSVPYIRTDSLNSALQDAIVALKYQNGKKEFSHGRLRTITMVGLQFPASKYPTTTAQPIGLRSTSFLFRILSQYDSNQGFFLNLQSGFDFRVLPQQQFGIPVIGRVGYGSSKWYADVWLDYFRSLDEDADQSIFGGSGARWLKTGGTFYVPLFKKFGVFAGGAYILTGRNIAKSWRVNVGVVYNWDPKTAATSP
ncbi:MAG: hypothetical protein GYB31_10590 [Bacteroidetes bacterium]|nr:hypothetical protein [Bacteroidota bacterium]